MEFLFLFFILFGVGAILGMAYVGIKAIIMATRGSIWFARGMGHALAEGARKGIEQGKADVAAREARKKERLRAQP